MCIGNNSERVFFGHIYVLLTNVSLLQFFNTLNTGQVPQVKECWGLSIASCPNCSTSKGSHLMHMYFKHKIIWFSSLIVLISEVTGRTFGYVAIYKNYFNGIGIKLSFFFHTRNSGHLFYVTVFIFSIIFLFLLFLNTFLLCSLIWVIICFLNIWFTLLLLCWI